jgi:hypothetical protein
MGDKGARWRKEKAQGGLCIQIQPGHVHCALGGRQLASFWATTVSRCEQLSQSIIESETRCFR